MIYYQIAQPYKQRSAVLLLRCFGKNPKLLQQDGKFPDQYKRSTNDKHACFKRIDDALLDQSE